MVEEGNISKKKQKCFIKSKDRIDASLVAQKLDNPKIIRREIVNLRCASQINQEYSLIPCCDVNESKMYFRLLHSWIHTY